MSGAPVILRSSGFYIDENGKQYGDPRAFTRFIGTYSGRLGADDEFKAHSGHRLVSRIDRRDNWRRPPR